jgi:hypothetical protein
MKDQVIHEEYDSVVLDALECHFASNSMIA